MDIPADSSADITTDTAVSNVPPGQPRSADGRYAGGAAPPSAPARRAYTVKSKSGGDETVEVDDAAISRALSFEREGHHRLRLLNEDRTKFSSERQAFEAERAAFEALLDDPEKLREYQNKRVKDPEEARRRRAVMVKRDMEERALTPEERERAELRAFKAQKEQEAADAQAEKERQAKEADLQARAEKVRPHLVKVLGEALDRGGLPKSPRHLSAMARYWQDNLQQGVHLGADELAAYAKSEMDADLDARMSDPELSDEAFATAYPGVMKRAEAILRARILKARGRPGPGTDLRREGPSLAPAAGARPAPTAHSSDEWRKLTSGRG